MNTLSTTITLALIATGITDAASTVSGSIDTTYASRYVTHGFNVGDTEAQQASLNLTADPLPGFQFTYWTSLTINRDLNAADEHDFMLLYNWCAMEGGTSQINFSSYLDYWWYPHTQINGDDLQGLKYHLGLSLPNALPSPGGIQLVPGYNFYHWDDRNDQFNDGAVHEFLLQATIPVNLGSCPLAPSSVGIKTTVNYNTGFLGVDPGWSHATVHLTTGAPITDAFSWHASLDYQWTLEDQLNGDGEDIFWATLGVTASF